MSEEALAALKAVNFDWTVRVDHVWETPEYHSPDLHRPIKQTLLDELAALQHSGAATPMGRVIVGNPGSGKTHLLSELRQRSMDDGNFFVLADLTDVRDFWSTLLLGYIDSLQQVGPGGTRQYERMLEHLYTRILTIKQADGQPVSLIGQLSASKLAVMIKKTIDALSTKYRREVRQHQDVIRAMILLASEDFDISDVGYSWLQGIEVDSAARRPFGLREACGQAASTVQGLSWLMSLAQPTLLAFDQLDAIVSQQNLAAGSGTEERLDDEQRTSLAIIEGIAGGLMALRDRTERTLLLVSCLNDTWEILKARAVASATDRFRPPLLLHRVAERAIAEAIMVKRLNAAYSAKGFKPPYPAYPFRPEVFEQARDYFPRQLLKACDAHRTACIAKGNVVELDRLGDQPPPPPDDRVDLSQLDQRFATLRNEIDPNKLTAEQDADDGDLAHLLRTACHCLLQEHPLGDDIDGIVDEEFSRRGRYPHLHARLRLVYRQEGDREQHFAFRALQRTHARAFQARLKAAMTASGIHRRLPFRRLVILRSHPLPQGRVTTGLVEEFKEAGGIIYEPSQDELRTLWAIARMNREQLPNFDAWLRERRPLSGLELMRAAKLCKPEDQGKKTPPPSDDKPDTKEGESAGDPAVNSGDATKHGQTKPLPLNEHPEPSELPLGRELVGSRPGAAFSIPLSDLTRHVVILAGSGSGKTVLLRRLVEEVASRGVPAVVLDGANDLSRLGQPWPQPPAEWEETDRTAAQRYFDNVETIVWTPGLNKGNPLRLDPLPDLAAVADDADELEQGVAMARSALEGIVAKGNSATAQKKQGVLASALHYFASQGRAGLDDFIEILSDLPADAGGGISKAQALAGEMSDQLKSQRAVNPLWKSQGDVLDPARLFGLDKGKTRISVLNLLGIAGLQNQQQFVAQLAMTLFTWIKKHPAPPGSPLRGILVIDEAKDFVPSGSSVPSQAALLRLAGQARKYGLGLILASQAPRSLDHNIVANCSTQFYGTANSPSAIETVKQMLNDKGGSGADVARLKAGQFYLHTESLKAPIKLATPLCLSHHPKTPPPEDEVIALAVQSKATVAD